ncbi:MAG: flagellar hook-associated protein FlgK [Planctomycetes bacterium]|nr:flagellar hook-associated protein FlgK [Planctomycetota bacterium]
MGLFNALNIGSTAITAQGQALQATGNNIANAATPGYSRQRVDFSTLGSQRQGAVFQGAGVGVLGLRRIVDENVEHRLREADSALGALVRRSSVYSQIETAFDALSDVSIGPQLSKFFDAANALSLNPADTAARRVFLQQAQATAATFNQVAQSLQQTRNLTDAQVGATVSDINRLATQIAQLNDQIVRAEVGGTVSAQANDLRDARGRALQELAQLADFHGVEQSNGSVDIVASGGFLVRGGSASKLDARQIGGLTQVFFADSGQRFAPTGGALGGLLNARDVATPQFMRELDQLARGMISAVNAVHATGTGGQPLTSILSQPFSAAHALGGAPLSVAGTVRSAGESGGFLIDAALKGYPSSTPGGSPDYFVGANVLITSGARAGETARITGYQPGTGRLTLDPPLAGLGAGDSFEVTSLAYPVKHGSFDLRVRNSVSGEEDVFNIKLDRDGLPTPPATDDTTLSEMVADINGQLAARFGANPPITARITTDLRLELVSTAADYGFSFGNDTSGFLAAAGINTLFAGNNAANIAVEQRVMDWPELLATGVAGLAGDNSTIAALAALQSGGLMAGGATLESFYQGMIGTLGVQSAEARELAENQDVVRTAFANEREAISGVNLDEEAVNLMTHQRAFQAASRYLAIVDDLLNNLLQSL